MAGVFDCSMCMSGTFSGSRNGFIVRYNFGFYLFLDDHRTKGTRKESRQRLVPEKTHLW